MTDKTPTSQAPPAKAAAPAETTDPSIRTQKYRDARGKLHEIKVKILRGGHRADATPRGD